MMHRIFSPEGLRIAELDEQDTRAEHAAQDAADALVVLGWPVRPADDDSDTWRIGYFVLTDDELIGLAARRGIQPAVGWVQ